MIDYDANKPMPETHSLRVKTDIYELTTVQNWFQKFGNSPQPKMPERVSSQMNLLLAEGFANVIYHAHEHLAADTPIDIEVIFSQNAIKMKIWDFGQPFNLLKKLEEIQQRQIDLSDIDNLPTGGRGLQITHAIADKFSYERVNNRNCLVICKNF